ncbi:hypothetical protein BGZ73_000002 [Actinomortierella ambigua]|nr:hypothetical protein BGZ73_000002 [Actinomortierella ambigua]
MISLKDKIMAANQPAGVRGLSAKERATQFVQDEVSQEKTIQMEPHKALYLMKCKDCTVTVEGKPVKIAIENCENLVLKVTDKVLTGVIDVWGSKNVEVDCERAVGFLQLDNVNGFTLKLPDPEYFNEMMWVGSDNIVLHLGTEKHELDQSKLKESHPSHRHELDQFKTSMKPTGLLTEAVIRLDAGFPATRAEEASYQRLERQKDAALGRDAVDA